MPGLLVSKSLRKTLETKGLREIGFNHMRTRTENSVIQWDKRTTEK